MIDYSPDLHNAVVIFSNARLMQLTSDAETTQHNEKALYVILTCATKNDAIYVLLAHFAHCETVHPLYGLATLALDVCKQNLRGIDLSYNG